MSNLRKFGYDLLPVTAGVLLALLINNAQQSWKERQFANQLIDNIIEENKANIQEIERLWDKQIQTIDSLNYYADSTDLSVIDVVLKLQGIQSPDLMNNGADYLLTGNQTIIDVEQLLKLAEINEVIKNFKLTLHQMVNELYDGAQSVEAEEKKKLALILNDVMSYEYTVKKLSVEFNAQYEE